MIQASTLLRVVDQKRTWNPEPTSPFRVQTDSHKVKPGDVFLALKGERFDAYKFIDQVLESKPAAVIFEQGDEREKEISQLAEKNPGVFFVETSSSLTFLQSLAKEHRLTWGKGKKEVLGLTGSNGKTTTKEILKVLLGEVLGETLHCTTGNLNNHIGVPLTLLQLEDHHELAIVEMGTNHAGEIAELCKIALPTCGLITNIGAAHIEHFKSPQNIFREKRALYDSVMSSTERSHFIVNEDDEFLKTLSITEGVKGFGRNSRDFHAEYDHDKLVIEFDERARKIQNNYLFGRHVYQNLGLALSLSILLFPEHKEKLLETAQDLKLPDNNRGEWQKFSGMDVFLDAYNANPNSMRASLETFAFQLKKMQIPQDDVLYVLGDMNELGDLGHDFHREVGEFLSDLGAKHVYFIGRYADAYAEGFGEALTFSTRAEAEDHYKNTAPKFKSIFLKASRSLQLESMTAIF